MGVYLSNIEMPRTHPITVEIYPNGAVLSKTVGRMDIHGNAVPVPPHGRLIDADSLKDLYHYNTHDSDIDKAWTGNIRRSIDSDPTVIEAEEPSGNSGELED